MMEEAVTALKECIKELKGLEEFSAYALKNKEKNYYDIVTIAYGFESTKQVDREAFLEFLLDEVYEVLFLRIDQLEMDVLKRLEQEL